MSGIGDPLARSYESLAGVGIFETLSDSALTDLEKRCRWRRYPAKQQVVGYLDDTRDVFFLVSGEVRVVIHSLSGKEVSFRDLGPGRIFGEFAAIDGKRRSATVIALKESLIASMPANVFWEVVRKHPTAHEAILKRLVEVARMLTERVVELSTVAVKSRIEAELLRLARGHMTGHNVAVISPAPRHVEIASRVSTHREAVTRELNALDRAGLIERQDSDLIIPDVRRLAHLVEEVVGELPFQSM